MRPNKDHTEVAIVGGGAAGIAVASSLLKREPTLEITVIDPAEMHYYQPGWTMVGGGIFDLPQTGRPMASVMPKAVSWKKLSVEAFEPDENRILLSSGERLSYDRMVVCPGLTLNWEGVEGLAETLGQNGVTSNYSYKTASYTWELVQSLRSGHAVFTQPPMPIKCAGAPQKAMYLSSNHWLRQGLLKDINVSFFTSTPGLFGVAAYVPALMKYVEKYQAALNFQHTLAKVDGEKQLATFKDEHGDQHEIEFDMLHVCPPQRAPGFIRESALADEAGWVDVDQDTLKSQRFDNIWALGDVMNAPNAKTAAAARAQAPVVAHNLLQHAGKRDGISHYNGYGSCPLTVERGKIVLAEFGYGGSLLPSFPKWLIDGQEPSSLAWLLKANVLPAVYWEAMLKGREWMVRPEPQH
jgi:sulfide:quinone oxidoreductase